MITLHKDIVIIGGGSAGMAAALEAKKSGINDILIIEKDNCLGGILNQCIHNGFGLHEFKEELTGPEYLTRFVDEIEKEHIEYWLESTVIKVKKNKELTVSTSKGLFKIHARAIIFATGCFERSPGSISLAGTRPSGVITAGAAQKYLNIYGYLVGKEVVILGSGDIGLIMARRLTLEGAKVKCVCELMPYSNGLNRNIVQCLNDFNIPLYLSTTIKEVKGKDRVESVIITKVDENLNFIDGSEEEIKCDTLLLSVGLIPYLGLFKNLGIEGDKTRGYKVNQFNETSLSGFFSCGNCLHVHDVVDYVSEEARQAGFGASLYIKKYGHHSKNIVNVSFSNEINYVVPQRVTYCPDYDVTFKFRVKCPIKDAFVVIYKNGTKVYKVFKNTLIPSEMVLIKVKKELLFDTHLDSVRIEIEKR
ncbi:MAG: NAD(P)/FAD-dependent oxidoreductase [Bacilli bacterium]